MTSVPTLYKFLPRRFGEDLLALGNVRLTTLFVCRGIESAGVGRADPDEGKKHIVQLPGPFSVTSEEEYAQLAPQLKRFIRRPGHYMNCEFADVQNVQRDQFILCMSWQISRRIEETFASGDDVWIEITDPIAFFRELALAVRPLGWFKGLAPVRYRPRAILYGDPDVGLNPVFLKDPTFELEYEWRAYWDPRQFILREHHMDPVSFTTSTKIITMPNPLVPVIITAPAIRSYCRLYQRAPSGRAPVAAAES